MLAAAVIAIVFACIFVVTWLSSRADAAQSRCDEHLRHIQHQLEVRPSPTVAPPPGPRPPARS
ncbi:MAG TPA: hypothetical protein VNS19_12725 [Acidimicrobiales bacterium]|jgi:hypothetical protein|nr:hypothetical protein [Acidimicrobiales bacterium]